MFGRLLKLEKASIDAVNRAFQKKEKTALFSLLRHFHISFKEITQLCLLGWSPAAFMDPMMRCVVFYWCCCIVSLGKPLSS